MENKYKDAKMKYEASFTTAKQVRYTKCISREHAISYFDFHSDLIPLINISDRVSLWESVQVVS